MITQVGYIEINDQCTDGKSFGDRTYVILNDGLLFLQEVNDSQELHKRNGAIHRKVENATELASFINTYKSRIKQITTWMCTASLYKDCLTLKHGVKELVYFITNNKQCTNMKEGVFELAMKEGNTNDLLRLYLPALFDLARQKYQDETNRGGAFDELTTAERKEFIQIYVDEFKALKPRKARA